MGKQSYSFPVLSRFCNGLTVSEDGEKINVDTGKEKWVGPERLKCAWTHSIVIVEEYAKYL